MFSRVKNFLFVNSGTKQTILKNSFWFAFGTTITKVSRAVIIVYVARIIGAEEYGIFTYALSIVGIFMLFSDIGLTSILIRELAKDDEEKKSFLSTITVVKIIFLVSTIILAGILGPLVSKFPESGHLIVFISIFVAMESIRGFFLAITRARNKVEKEAGLSIVAELISITLILILFLKNPTASSLVNAFIIGNILSLILTVGFLHKSLDGITRNFKRSLVKPIVRASWPFAIMGVFGIFMTNIDSVMLGFWNTPATLGLYAAAQKPIGLMYILPAFITVSLFPLFSKLVANAANHTKKVVQKSYKVSMSLAIPIVVGGIILAGPLINVTFGQEYSPATLTFQILLITLIVAFPGAIFSDVLIANDSQKKILRSSIFGAITNVGLNILLIPKYGIAGSAISTLIAQIVLNGILYIETHKLYKINLFKGLGKIIFASIIVALISYILKIYSVPLLVIVPACAFAYLLILSLTKDDLILDLKQALR